MGLGSFSEKEFRDEQKMRTRFFQLWRAGKVNHFDSHVKNAAKKDSFPRVGTWQGHERIRFPSKPQRIRSTHDEVGPGSLRPQAHKAAQQLEAQLKASNIRFEKMIGWGGGGIACLCETTKENGEKFKIVCKASISQNPDDTLELEWDNHMVRKPPMDIAEWHPV